jgi:hypothetical protein
MTHTMRIFKKEHVFEKDSLVVIDGVLNICIAVYDVPAGGYPKPADDAGWPAVDAVDYTFIVKG